MKNGLMIIDHFMVQSASWVIRANFVLKMYRTIKVFVVCTSG